MTLKSDAKFKKKLSGGFKCDMRNLINFHPTIQKSKNFTLIGYFCPKYMKFELKKYRAFNFHDTKQCCKIGINLNLEVSKIAWRIGWTLTRVPKSLKNCSLLGSFCPKHISVRKFQRSYLSWPWRVLQNLKENWLVTWKMTLGIWLIFMKAVESLKICILIGSFCPKHTKI